MNYKEFREKYLPKTVEREEQENMSPEEIGRQLARKVIEEVEATVRLAEGQT